MTIAGHCDLTVIDGRPALRLRSDNVDVAYPLTPSEAAAIIRRLAIALEQYVKPHTDRTDQSTSHPDNHTLRDGDHR